jgi:hypothetical protein
VADEDLLSKNWSKGLTPIDIELIEKREGGKYNSCDVLGGEEIALVFSNVHHLISFEIAVAVDYHVCID